MVTDAERTVLAAVQAFKGDLRDMPLPELLMQLHVQGATGSLEIAVPDGTAVDAIYFDAGTPVAARADRGAQSVADVLVPLCARGNGRFAFHPDENKLGGGHVLVHGPADPLAVITTAMRGPARQDAIDRAMDALAGERFRLKAHAQPDRYGFSPNERSLVDGLGEAWMTTQDLLVISPLHEPHVKRLLYVLCVTRALTLPSSTDRATSGTATRRDPADRLSTTSLPRPAPVQLVEPSAPEPSVRAPAAPTLLEHAPQNVPVAIERERSVPALEQEAPTREVRAPSGAWSQPPPMTTREEIPRAEIPQVADVPRMEIPRPPRAVFAQPAPDVSASEPAVQASEAPRQEPVAQLPPPSPPRPAMNPPAPVAPESRGAAAPMASPDAPAAAPNRRLLGARAPVPAPSGKAKGTDEGRYSVREPRHGRSEHEMPAVEPRRRVRKRRPPRQSRPIDAKRGAAHHMKAQALVERQSYDRALAQIRAAISADDSRAEYEALHGWLLYELRERIGDAELQAKVHLDRALRLDPRCAKAHYYKGMVLKRQGQADGAYEHFAQAVALDPEDLASLREMRVYEMRRRPGRDAKPSGLLRLVQQAMGKSGDD